MNLRMRWRAARGSKQGPFLAARRAWRLDPWPWGSIMLTFAPRFRASANLYKGPFQVIESNNAHFSLVFTKTLYASTTSASELGKQTIWKLSGFPGCCLSPAYLFRTLLCCERRSACGWLVKRVQGDLQHRTACTGQDRGAGGAEVRAGPAPRVPRLVGDKTTPRARAEWRWAHSWGAQGRRWTGLPLH